MTKKQFKIYLKFGTLLFGIALLIIACTKDEEYFIDKTVASETNPIGTINPSDINKNVIDWNEFMLRTSLDASSDIFQSFDISSSRNLSEFVIATESDNDNEVLIVSEIEMINYNDVTTYTFVVLENNDEHSFRNLILRTENNIDFEAFIALYNPTEDWLNSNQDITPFQGQVQINPYTGNYQVVTQSGTTTTCTFSIDVVWECDAENNHPPGHPRCKVGGAEIIAINITETCYTTSVGGSNPDNGIPWQGENNDSSNYNNGGLNNNPNDNENTTDNDNNLPLDGLLTIPRTLTPSKEKDCDELEKNEEDATFNQYMQVLEDNVANGTVEKGFNTLYLPATETQPAIETFVFPQQVIEGTESGVNLPYHTFRKTASHNHCANNPNHLKIFAQMDIVVLGSILSVQQNNPNSPLEIEQLANYLAADGGTYALKVDEENLDNLLDFTLKYPLKISDADGNETTNPNFDLMVKLRVDKYYREQISPKFDKHKQIKEFLNFAAQENLGVSLYEKNNTTGQWDKVHLDDNGAVKRTPCDEL